MFPPALLLSLLSLAVVVSMGLYPTRGPSLSSARRDLDRRGRYLRKRPAQATANDVRRVLIASVPAGTVEHATTLARERRVPPPLLWQWADRNGAEMLVLTLSAGLDHADLLATLEDASSLDVDSLEMLSDLYRHPVSLTDLTRAADARSRPASRFGTGVHHRLLRAAFPARTP